jgi:hypothetical protein
MKTNHYSQNKHCKCGKLITNESKFCISCGWKYYKGKNHHSYKDGRSLKKHYCVDCKKEVSDYRVKRCLSCAAKRKVKLGLTSFGRKGKNHPNYIDGRTNKKYYCKICGKKICLNTALYGKGRCRECMGIENRGKNNYMYKEKIKVNCETCNKELLLLPSRIQNSKHHFCSRKCRGKWDSVHRIGKQANSYINGNAHRIFHCINCGKKVCCRTFRNYIKGESLGLCISCLGKYRKGKNSYNWKGGKKQVKCDNENCKKLFFKHPCLIKKTKHNFCSHKCYSKWLSIHKRGRNSNMFGKKANTGKIFLYKNIKFRSSWEVTYAKYLTKNHIKWQYEPKTFDLGNTTYTPDFYLPESDTYVEVKGWWRDDAKFKYLKFRRKFGNIILLNEQRLKKLGVIK